MDFIIVSLRAKLEEIKSDKAKMHKLQKALSLFNCSRNNDEQTFLREKAIDFEYSGKSRTYLLISKNKIIAYFSLAFKSIDLVTVSSSTRRRMTAGENVETYASYLIGHLAKDDSVSEKMIDILLGNAISLILESQKIIGGRLVYLDCKNETKLINLYTEYGFKHFNISKSGLIQLYMKI